MKTAIIIRTGEIFCKHLHDIGTLHNCCVFKSQIGLWGGGKVREQILVTKGVTGQPIQSPPTNYIS